MGLSADKETESRGVWGYGQQGREKPGLLKVDRVDVGVSLSGHMTKMPQEHLVQGGSKPHGYRVRAKGYPGASRERGG